MLPRGRKWGGVGGGAGYHDGEGVVVAQHGCTFRSISSLDAVRIPKVRMDDMREKKTKTCGLKCKER